MNILTIDFEDWFHILAHEETSSPEHWQNFESRIEANTKRLIDLFQEKKQKATWFCLGWQAKKNPELIKIISSQFDIGCHSDLHQLVYTQNIKSFKEDTIRVKNTLEDLTGKKIISYRAAGFSITGKSKWAFDVIAECGFEIDCSVFPLKRNHGGFPEMNYNKPFIIRTNGMKLKEFPVSTGKFFGKELVFAGGGYFRAFPYSLIASHIKSSSYTMTYFHPRDFDREQPMIKSLPWKRKMMSYAGLKTAEKKFERMLSEFKFTDIRESDKLVDWTTADIIVV